MHPDCQRYGTNSSEDLPSRSKCRLQRPCLLSSLVTLPTMINIPLGPVLALLPLIGATSILNHLNPAYVPALGLLILAIKQWFFPPLLRPLSKPEATSRLKFNLFVLLHIAILIFVFPPYMSIKRGMVWYADEYLQGRRGGQKSWATSVVQSAGTSHHDVDLKFQGNGKQTDE